MPAPVEMGFTLLATRGTAAFLREAGLEVETVNKVLEGRPHIVDRMLSGGCSLFSTPPKVRKPRPIVSVCAAPPW